MTPSSASTPEGRRPKLGPGDTAYIIAWCAWRRAVIESDPDLSADEIRQRFVRWWSEIGEVQLEEYGYRLMDTTGEPGPTEGLPDDLARVLRDQSIIVPQDAAVFELIAKWRNAPSNTASAD